MTNWTPQLSAYPGPRYRAIAEALAAAVADGTLLPGTRLPTHRELAEALGVTVGTVTRAYAEAEARGLTEGTVGRGTFVREPRVQAPRMIAPQGPGLVDLSVNRPTLAPQVPALAETLTELARAPDLATLLGYTPDAGLPAHREAAAAWIGELGLAVRGEQVVIACGAQNALLATITALTEPGDVMLTEALGYPGTLAIASQARLRVHGVAIDREGLIPEAFAEACERLRPRLLACVANLHNPTTAVLSAARRARIAEIARAHDVLILDDDVYGFLIENRPPPLASFAPERSCYVTCTSKALVPGLRVGFVAGPTELVGRVAAAVRTSVWMAPPLMAEIAARWISDGTAARLMAWQREEGRARQALAAQYLGRWRPECQPCGFHLWLPLPEPWTVGGYVAAARARGVAVTPSEVFVVGRGAAPPAIRVCLGGPAMREELERGLATLAELLDAHAPGALLTP